MRVTNMYMVQLAQAATAKNQSNVAQLTQEVSSGLRVEKPSDDPTAWIEAQREKVQSALDTGVNEAIQQSSTRLNAVDGALQSLSSIFSQVQAMAVEGASAQLTPSARADLGQQVSALFQQAIAIGNSKAPDGSYLFAGTDNALPFSSNGNYNGNATSISVNTDTVSTAPASLAGGVLDAGNVLLSIGDLATALSANDLPNIQAGVANMNAAVAQLSTTRAQVGGMMTTMQSAQNASSTLATTLTTSVSNLVDADTMQSASQLAQASTALQVSQAVTTKVLSLLGPSSS